MVDLLRLFSLFLELVSKMGSCPFLNRSKLRPREEGRGLRVAPEASAVTSASDRAILGAARSGFKKVFLKPLLVVLFGFVTSAHAAQASSAMVVQAPPELRIAFMLITCVMCFLAAFMEIKERRTGKSKESRISFAARSSALVLTALGYVAGAYVVFVRIP